MLSPTVVSAVIYACMLVILCIGFSPTRARIAIYLLVVRPVQRTGSGGIILAFSMFALSRILASVLTVYSY